MEMIVEQLRKINNSIWYNDGTFERNLFPQCDKMYIGVVDNPDKKPAHGVEWISNWFNNQSSKVVDAGDKLYPGEKETK